MSIPQLDDLKRNTTTNWFDLLGHIHHAATALADFLEELVTAYAVAGPFRDECRPSAQERGEGRICAAPGSGRARVHEFSGPVMHPKQSLKRFKEGLVPGAGFAEVGFAGGRGIATQRLFKDGFFAVHSTV